MNAITSNPNASVAAVSGAATVLLIFILSFAGVDVPPEAAAALTTLISTLVLFLGKKRPPVAP